ncbi:hypothetical protein FBQ95_05265 [Chloroflexi bacterium CFX3]|nr:hypothetical protein [Chloroflexi bacterium CFX3]
MSIRDQTDMHHLNLDDSHTPAKKAQNANVLPITDTKGFILATTGIVAGNPKNAFDLEDNLRAAFKFI